MFIRVLIAVTGFVLISSLSAAQGKSASDCEAEIGPQPSPSQREKAMIRCLLGQEVTSTQPSQVWGAKEIFSFAKKYANKFGPELSGATPAVGSRIRVRLHTSPLYLRYSTTTGFASLPSLGQIFNANTLTENCKGAGSYVGQNALGTKAKVVKKTCERVTLYPESVISSKKLSHSYLKSTTYR